MTADLRDRVIVVTGGSRGVGRSVVQRLSASGARVVFQGRDHASADETIRMAEGPTPDFVPGDLADYDSIDHLCSEAVRMHGHLDGAVGSGVPTLGLASRFEAVEPGLILEYFKSHALPRIHLTHAAAKHMSATGYGKVVLLTTDAGRTPTPGESLIGAAAASVIFMTRAVAKEFATTGVRVNSLAISLTKDTPAYDRFLETRGADDAGVLHKAFARIEERTPFGLATANEVADVAAFLLGAESDGITGATFSINRGSHFPVYA